MHQTAGRRRKVALCSVPTLLLAVACLLAGYSLAHWMDITRQGREESSPPPQLTQALGPKDGRRLMYTVPVYGTEQLLCLQRALDAVLDICNAGWNVSIFLQVANGLEPDDALVQEFRQRMFCAYSGSYIPVHVDSYTHLPNIGRGLVRTHRALMSRHLEAFDYFIYGEDDMVITLSTLQAFLRQERLLRAAMPRGWVFFSPGFIRYEERAQGVDRVTWERREPRVVDLGPRLGSAIMSNNPHQAFYIFSREQLADLERRCGFLSDSGKNAFFVELRRAMKAQWKSMDVNVQEWSSSFQQVLQCGIRSVIPLDSFQNHFVLHAANIAQTRRPAKELMSMRQWGEAVAALSQRPLSLRQMDQIVFEQYNLHMMDPERFYGKSKWAWNITIEPEAQVPY